MADILKWAQQVKLANLASDPASSENGSLYYNTTSNKVRQYLNGAWADVSAGSVSLTGQALNDGEIIVGNASNLSAAVDTDTVGDVQADHSGGLTIKSGVIVDAQVSSSAAIARSKLASGNANRVVVNDASGVQSDAAAITASRALVSDSNGIPTHSSVTSTELGYVSGVTSAIQTQLGTKATKALDNLASVAINASLVADSNNSKDLGSDSIEWKDAWVHSVSHSDSSNPDLSVQTTGNNGSIVISANGSGNLDSKSTKFRRSSDATSSNFIEEQYVDALTLSDNQTGTVVSQLGFAHASFEGQEIHYKIKEATSNKVRFGKVSIATNGSVVSLIDEFHDTSDVGVSFAAVVNGANIDVSYTTTNTGNSRVMRCDIKRFRA